jgi:hypothetical protein
MGTHTGVARPRDAAARDLATTGAAPAWAVSLVWLVVNAVNLLQSIGFVTRPFAPGVNPALGLVIVALGVPAGVALAGFVRAGAGWRHVLGPVVFIGFIGFSVVVDYWLDIEFRSPRVTAILVPYLTLFFGGILLMGLPMFRIDRSRWAVTAATTALLLATMVWALAHGVG